jgi:hypothetical protein
MKHEQSGTKRTSREKLDSYAEVMSWDRAAQQRAILYAKLLRRMIDAFGEGVLDIAENVRRENGRYAGDMLVDIVENEKLYRQDPSLLIYQVHEHFETHPADWSRTCICFYKPVPEKRYHELRSVRCTYAEAFRSVGEEKIGITWCCYDMGFTSAFHPLFCQYMPMHMLKGDAFCLQIRMLAETPEEQTRLNSIEHTGWRSWK